MFRNFKIVVFNLVCFAFSIVNAQQERQLYEDSLSVEERIVLNEIFKDYRGEKDFNNLKVAFFSSPGGTVQRFHEHYFEVLDLNDLNTRHPLGNLIFFTEKEKAKHGYDVAIIYVSKNNQPRLNRRLTVTKKDYLKQRNAHNTQ
jgi:hypothetical protein